MKTMTSTDVARAAGLTSRQLDYLVRTGIIIPWSGAPRGSGVPWRWAPDQVRIIRLLAVLREHGAEVDTLRRVAQVVELLPDDAWTGPVVVSRAGIVAAVGDGVDGWIVDLARCIVRQEPQLVA